MCDYFTSRLEPDSQAGLCIQSIEKLMVPDQLALYKTILKEMRRTERERSRTGKVAIEDDKIELAWAFHACAAEAVESIIRPRGGFNRSYAGKNATKYGPGCYFARDSSYSARSTYSPPDQQGVKRIFMCRVALGAHTKVPFGYDDKEPPVRDNDHGADGVGRLKYDSTTNDNFNKDGIPEIMVTYKDGAAYPEYLVAFFDLSQPFTW